MIVESLAVRVEPRALAAGGGRIWVAERSGGIASVEARSGRVAARWPLDLEILDLAWLPESLAILSVGGERFDFDPATGRVLGRGSLSGFRGLAARGEAIWGLDAGGRELRPLAGPGTPIAFEVPVLAARWGIGGALFALSIPERTDPPAFSWRGLAPGPDPARPGPGGATALVRFDGGGRVVERVELDQEAVALAVDGSDVWYGVRAAEGLERLAGGVA